MRRYVLLIAALLLGSTAPAFAASTEPRRVLVLYSYEREFAHDGFARIFRAELSRASAEPIDFIEMSLQTARSSQDAAPDETTLARLRSTFGRQRLDMVVTIGGPAATFAQKFRSQLFPETPLLLAGVDRRFIKGHLGANDAAVTVDHDPVKTVDTILQLLPDTKNVFVIIGASRLEQFWLAEVKTAFQRYDGRLSFTWTNQLSVEEILQRSATLPPQTAILFAILTLDAKGVPQVGETTLVQMHERANAPIFGLSELSLGHGIVGGPLLSMDELGVNTAAVALRMLRGDPPPAMPTPTEIAGKPTFDARELERWGIDERRLTSGSVVLFREPSVWQRYRRTIVTVATLQALVVIALVVGLVKRRRGRTGDPVPQDQFHQVSQSLPALVRVMGPGGLAADVNRAWLDYTGRTAESEVGNGWLDAVHADDRANCLTTMAQAFGRQQPFRMRYRLRRHDGEYRWLLDTAVPRTTGDGAPAGYVSCAIDVTEMEVARGALARLSQRLMTSHENERAWLAKELMEDLGQRTIALTIRLSVLSEVQNTGVEHMRAGIDDLRRQFLDLSSEIMGISDRLYSFKLDLLGLPAAVRNYCEELSAKHGVPIAFREEQVPPNIPGNIVLALFRVLQEALGNALRHSGASQVLVSVSGAGNELRLGVIDAGRGFDPEAAMKDSGVGLVAMRERIHLVHGVCDIDSSPGVGTSVVARVPLSFQSTVATGTI